MAQVPPAPDRSILVLRRPCDYPRPRPHPHRLVALGHHQQGLCLVHRFAYQICIRRVEILVFGIFAIPELSRAFLASFILVLDLTIVMQDWDFPHFTNTLDVNLPGWNKHEVSFSAVELKISGTQTRDCSFLSQEIISTSFPQIKASGSTTASWC